MRKRPSATSASEPPKKNGETGRSLLVESEPLPLPQLREGRGNAPSQGDVIEAEIPDASGRAVGKVMLEALEVSPAEKSGIFARVACTGVVDMELADYAVQVLGMRKERKEFVVYLCTPQEPGRCEETGAALHCGKWSVVPGEADRGVGGASVETSERTDKGLRPEIAEAGPALFAPMDGEGLGAQVATLAGELGLDPPARPMERKSLSAPRSPHLGSRFGDRSPRAGVREPSGGKKGVESQMSRHMLPSPAFWTPPAVRAPPAAAQGATLVAALREKLKEARARLGRKRRGRKWLLEVLAERVRESTADALAMAELDSRRRRGQAGSSEDTGKRNRREREREGKKRGSSSSSGEMAEYSSTDEGLEREDDSKVRRTAASKPGALLHSGLVMMHRHLGRQVEDCETVDAVQAKGVAAAYLSTALKPNAGEQVQEHSRIALFSRSRGSADAWTSGECRRRPDPEIPRSGSGGTGGRGMVTRTSSRTAASSSSVDSVIWSSGSDDQSRAGFFPIAPEPEDTESQAKARGGRRSAVEEEEPRADRQRIREERPPHETSNGGTKPEEGKARAKENEASS